MATVGRLTLKQLIANSDVQANQLAVTSDSQFSGPAVFSDIVYFDGGANSDLVSGLNADMFDGAQLDTDATLAGDTDVSVPTEHAVKTYADTLVAGATVVHTTGDETIAGTKTFSTDIVGDLNGGIKETGSGGVILKPKVIEIGDWNLQTTATIDLDALITGAGIALANVRSFSVVLRGDDQTTIVALGPYQGGSNQAVLYVSSTNYIFGYWYCSMGTWTLGREVANSPSYANWDATSFNRGWVTVWYEA